MRELNTTMSEVHEDLDEWQYCMETHIKKGELRAFTMGPTEVLHLIKELRLARERSGGKFKGRCKLCNDAVMTIGLMIRPGVIFCEPCWNRVETIWRGNRQ